MFILVAKEATILISRITVFNYDKFSTTFEITKNKINRKGSFENLVQHFQIRLVNNFYIIINNYLYIIS